MVPATMRTAWVGSGTSAGGREHAAVADIERRAVQRAHQPRRAQPSFAQARVRMGADVVEREHALARVADDELAAARASHVRMPPSGSSASFSTAWNSAMRRLQLDLGLEDFDTAWPLIHTPSSRLRR